MAEIRDVMSRAEFNDPVFLLEFADMIGQLGGESALEIGCHSGEMMAAAITTALAVTGIDPEGVAEARAFLAEMGLDAHLVAAGVLSWETAQTFDLVYSSGLLEHYEREEAILILQKMADLSKRWVLNFVPNTNCAAYRGFKSRTNAEWKDEKDFTEETLAELYQAAGLMVVKTGKAGQAWSRRFGDEPSEPYLVWVLAEKATPKESTPEEEPARDGNDQEPEPMFKAIPAKKQR